MKLVGQERGKAHIGKIPQKNQENREGSRMGQKGQKGQEKEVRVQIEKPPPPRLNPPRLAALELCYSMPPSKCSEPPNGHGLGTPTPAQLFST